MKDFFKAFLSFGLASSIEKLLGFIILPIYTREFNKVEYGVIDMVGTVIGVATIFSLLQLETSLQRYYYEDKDLKRKLLITNTYIWIGGCSVVVGTLIFCLSSVLSQKLFKTDEFAGLIRMAAIQLPLGNLGMLGLLLLRFQKENIKFLIVIITKVVFSLFLVYLFVIHLRLGLSGVFYAQVGSMLITTSIVTFFVRDNFVWRFSSNISYRNFKYALPQIPAGVGSMVLGQANRFFMLGYLSLGAIGIYSVSIRLASSIQLVNTAFILAWAPFMHAQFKKQNNKTVFANVFPIVVAGTFLFVCLISLYSQEMVKLLTTEEFYSSYKYIGGLALFFSLYIIKETIDIGPKIREKTKFLSFTFFLSVIINLSSLFLFIRYFQIEGVVISMIITNLFLIVISWIISNKLYYIPFSVSKFIILLIPALVLSVLTMVTDLALYVRIITSVCFILFYGILFLRYYKTFRSLAI
ncbi:MAG: lipopolysaccharide biosynthesis protein [Ginsengibacter sp.]